MALCQHPVFIVGCGRSGTTLLRLMLSSSQGLMIPPESDFLWRAASRFGPGSRLGASEITAFIDYIQQISSFPGLELDGAQLLTALLQKQPRSVAECIAQVYVTYAAQRGRTRWGDKNPFYVLRLDLIHRLFPNARVIHVIRDGRDVAVSYEKTKMRPQNVFVMASRWQRCIHAGRRWGAAHPSQYLEVRYEGLVAEAESQLRRVCSFIAEDFTPEMLTYHERNEHLEQIPASERGHHTNLAKPLIEGNHGKWRTRMGPADRYVFESVAGRTLAELGYEISQLPRRRSLDIYIASCRLRSTLGRTRPLSNLTDAPHWRARQLARKTFLIDNDHYREAHDSTCRK